MILPIAALLPPDRVAFVRERLSAGTFEEGRRTAGWNARLVKDNDQLSASDPAHGELRSLVEAAVRNHPVAALATRPKAFGPILFSRTGPGQRYGAHVDDALMGGIRTDVSFTLFLSDPGDYDGGELVMEMAGGEMGFRLPAGSALFYPSNSLHRVETVTRGERLVAAGWIRSFIRDPAEREILFDLDTARRSMFRDQGKSAEFDLLSKCLSNLLRKWTDD